MSSAEGCRGGLFCSNAVARFHVDDCRETEIRFECLKEVVIAHRFYLKEQSYIVFLTFLCSGGSAYHSQSQNKWLLLRSRLHVFTTGEDRFHGVALTRPLGVFFVKKINSQSVRNALCTLQIVLKTPVKPRAWYGII